MEMIITMDGKAQVNASFKGQIIKTDQPIEGGGDNSAPAPFDFFLASIGTCAGIYVKSFCDKRGISTKDIRIVQTMGIDPVKRMVGSITLDIQLPADFPKSIRMLW